MKSRPRSLRLALAACLVAALGVTAACQPTKAGGAPPRVMMIGDSTAQNLADALEPVFNAAGRAFDDVTQPGCGVLRGRFADFAGNEVPWAANCDASVWLAHQENLEQFRPDVVLWFGIVETFPRFVDGGFYQPMTPEGDQKIWLLMEEKYQQIRSFGAHLFFILMPPPTTTENNFDVRVAHLNSQMLAFAQTHSDVGIVDLAGWACPGGIPCPEVVDGVALRPDQNGKQEGVHWSPAGADWAAQRIVPDVLRWY